MGASMLQMQPKENQALQPNLDPAVKDYDALAPAQVPADHSQDDWTTEEFDGDELAEGWEDETDEDDDGPLNVDLHHQDENDENEHELLKEGNGFCSVGEKNDPVAHRRRCCGDRRRSSSCGCR